MSFSVNLIALRGLPPFLDRRARELASASGYVTAHTHLDYGPGLVDVAGRHRENVRQVTGFLDRAATAYAGDDAIRLRQVTIDYAMSDARAASRADSTLPRVPGGQIDGVITPAERNLGPEIFDDRDHPAADLPVPADHHGDMPYKPGWFDLLSPTSLARDAVWELTGLAARMGILDRAYDPFELIVCPLVGDWAGLLRCAEVFDHVADFVHDEARVIRGVELMVPEVWTGRAAAACRANLGDFSVALGAGQDPLRSAATAYREIAVGVHDNADLLGTVVTEIADLAIETSVNAETWGIFGAYEVGSGLSNLIRSLRAALRIVAKVQDVLNTGMSISDEAMHRLGLMTALLRMPPMSVPAPPIPAVR